MKPGKEHYLLYGIFLCLSLPMWRFPIFEKREGQAARLIACKGLWRCACSVHLSQRNERLPETARGGLTAGSAYLLLKFLQKERWHAATFTLEKHAMFCNDSVAPILFWRTHCLYFPTLFNTYAQIVSW